MLAEQEGKKLESLSYEELFRISKEPKSYWIEFQDEKYSVETDVTLAKNGELLVFAIVDRGKIFEIGRGYGFTKKKDGTVCPP